MLRSIIPAVIATVFSASTVSAQLYRGTVINAITKNAVTGVTVTITGTGATTVTDTNGIFVFWNENGPVTDGNDGNSNERPVLLNGNVYLPTADPYRVSVSTVDGKRSMAALAPNGRLDMVRTDGLVVIAVDNAVLCRVLLIHGRAAALTGIAAGTAGIRPSTAKSTAAAGSDTLVFSRNGYIPSSFTVYGPADTIHQTIEREYDIPVFSDFTDGTVNRGYFPFVDNETWQISTYCCGTGRNHFMLENCVFTDTVAGDSGNGYLHMTVQANTTNGAEIWSTMKTHYGFYETRMKTAAIAGACNAFFLQDWNNGHIGEEVDYEFLTGDYDGMADYGIAMCMLHPNGGGSGRALPFNPGTGFHRYGWIWTPDTLKWLADGEVIQTVTDTLLIPDGYVQMVYNNWTGSAGWGGGPPTEDNTMIIDWCRYYPDADTVVPLVE